jgi:DNA helicase-2/ATP-dependent DNA helicase PcrA
MLHDHITEFNTFISTSLNKAQKQAVTHESGTVLVIAGAGSGKTRVITARITHLILNKNIDPTLIVALTFTNKAAQEMKQRIRTFLPAGSQMPFIGTFHSYCLRILKRFNPEPFSILDEDDQKKIISRILEGTHLHKQIATRTAIYQISHVKNQLTSATQNPRGLFENPLMADVYDAYEKEKKESKCFDFDDLLLQTLTLMKKNPQFQKMHHASVRHILVDEYQDTNGVQNELLKQMTLHNNTFVIDSLCAVGDEDQSIYSWRGATIANMLNFSKDFPNATTIKIEQNYRSVQPILDLANTVIEHNSQRNPKQLWSEKKGTDRIRILTCASEYQESSMITQFLSVATAHQRKDSIAILYRTHTQSRAIEEALIKEFIPYKIIGGIQFYNRKEIKDLLAYLRLIVNPFDRPSFFRIINTPTRGLGPKFEEECFTLWHNEPFLTCLQLLHKMIETGIVKKAKQASITTFMSLFEHTNAHQKPRDTIEMIVKKTGYIQYLQDQYEPAEVQTRVENINELMDGMKHFESQGINTIELFLNEVALMQDSMNEADSKHDKVLLMTLHAAKGLEFETIILAGLEEGIIPSIRSIESDDALQEERRLFYVGITRAKERLLMLHAKYRYTYGKMVDQCVSQQRTYFADWLGMNTAALTAPAKHTARIKQNNKTTPQESSSAITPTASTEWRANRPVKHATFGVGIVKTTETKGEKTYVQVQFKNGLKKILADYLQQA